MTFEELEKEWLSSQDFIEARTSGSTGKPKIIRLPKHFVERSARATNAFFGLNTGSRYHSCVAADFIGGKMMLIRALISGGRFSFEIPSNRPLSGLSREETIDLLAVVPSQMMHLLNNLDSLPRIRNIIIGGSSIHPELRKRIADSGLNSYETYGMTETASHIALRRIGESPEPFSVINNVALRTDSRGCLVIGFDDGTEIITNDITEINADGTFNILGRFDNVIVTGGKKLHPEEVEKIISERSGYDLVISSLSHPKWGEEAVAVVSDSDAIPAIEKLLISDILPHWKLPKRILLMREIPLTPNGKTDRRALRKAIQRKFG